MKSLALICEKQGWFRLQLILPFSKHIIYIIKGNAFIFTKIYSVIFIKLGFYIITANINNLVQLQTQLLKFETEN